jgi:hypothetical protein
MQVTIQRICLNLWLIGLGYCGTSIREIMEEPTAKKLTDSTAPSEGQPAGSRPPPNPAGGGPAVAPPAQTGAAPGPASTASPLQSAKYLADKLEEAELLLGYAAEVGIEVEDKVRDDVLRARVESGSGGITEPTASALLTALTTLAVDVRPVTVQSLRSCSDTKDARKTLRAYGTSALVCAVPIMLFSLGAFVSNYYANKIKTEVDAANGLALKLQADLGPSSTNQLPADAVERTNNRTADQIWWGTNEPPRGLTDKDVLSDLREFTASMREIDGYARQLNHFVFGKGLDPYAGKRSDRTYMRKKLELTPGLKVRLSWEFAEKVEAYQEVRYFATNVQEMVSVWYGALATCVLPVLYALLGAGACLLRMYEGQIKNRTFIAGDRHVAHFLTAGIGGLVVGQFNVAQGVTISPFAVAFLVGYAVDAFFAFLDGMLQMFKRGPGSSGTPGAPSNP